MASGLSTGGIGGVFWSWDRVQAGLARAFGIIGVHLVWHTGQVVMTNHCGRFWCNRLFMGRGSHPDGEELESVSALRLKHRGSPEAMDRESMTSNQGISCCASISYIEHSISRNLQIRQWEDIRIPFLPKRPCHTGVVLSQQAYIFSTSPFSTCSPPSSRDLIFSSCTFRTASAALLISAGARLE